MSVDPRDEFPQYITPKSPFSPAIEYVHEDTGEIVHHEDLIEADFRKVPYLKWYPKDADGKYMYTRGQKHTMSKVGPWRPRWVEGKVVKIEDKPAFDPSYGMCFTESNPSAADGWAAAFFHGAKKYNGARRLPRRVTQLSAKCADSQLIGRKWTYDDLGARFIFHYGDEVTIISEEDLVVRGWGHSIRPDGAYSLHPCRTAAQVFEDMTAHGAKTGRWDSARYRKEVLADVPWAEADIKPKATNAFNDYQGWYAVAARYGVSVDDMMAWANTCGTTPTVVLREGIPTIRVMTGHGECDIDSFEKWGDKRPEGCSAIRANPHAIKVTR